MEFRKHMTTREINEFLLHFRHLLLRPDVVSIDVRRKTQGGRRTGDLALVVGVMKKLPPGALPPGALIPPGVRATIDGETVELPTDVIDEGAIRPLAAEGGDMVRTAGLSKAGSLGVNITWRGQYRLLSNAHVLTYYEAAFVGAMIAYSSDGGDEYQDLVPVSGQEFVVTYADQNQQNPVYNIFDFAWADITEELGAPTIREIGQPAGLAVPEVGQEVQVYGGFSQSLDTSTVLSVTAQYRSAWTTSAGAPIYMWWQSGITLDGTTMSGIPGDSGSAVVTTAGMMVVGLIATGSLANIYASPIPDFLAG